MKTLVIVDDDPDQAELLAAALVGEGRRIRVFSDPIRALSVLSGEGADLLIADLSMPWVDGAQIVEMARRELPMLEVILVSAYGRCTAVAQRLGARVFLKPIPLDELRQVVDSALETSVAAPAPSL